MPFIIEKSKKILTTHAGLTVVGQLLQTTQRDAHRNATTLADRPSPEIRHGEVVSAYVGFLCLGKNDFDHFAAHREDEGFRRAIGLNVVPSSPTLRQRLDQAAGAVGREEIVREGSARLLAAVRSTVTLVADVDRLPVPLDVDVSPWNNSGTKKANGHRDGPAFADRLGV